MSNEKSFLGVDKAKGPDKTVLTLVEVDPDTGERRIVRIENPTAEQVVEATRTSKNFRLRVE